MSKRNRADLLTEGDRLLASWEVSDAAAPAALETHLGRSVATDVAIAHRLGALASDDSVRVLQRLEHSSADKLVRKEAKRALYRLQQRGVAVPQERAPAPPPIVQAVVEGYVSPVDGHGDQLIWIVRPRPSGIAHLFALINDPAGLREVELNLITRKALRHLRDELATKHDLRLVDADATYCDFLIHRALGWARSQGTPMTGDYPALRAQILKAPPADDLPPLVLSRIDAEAIKRDPVILGRSAGLLEEPELRTWFFGPEQLKPYLDELAGIRESPLVLNRVQQEERFRVAVERAVVDLFGDQWRMAYARRLYEMAYFFAVTARTSRAGEAVAVAHALTESTQGGRGIPFCEHLARASLSLYFQAAVEDEQERAKSSLVVTPQQFANEMRRR